MKKQVLAVSAALFLSAVCLGQCVPFRQGQLHRKPQQLQFAVL